jgi:hypothetical protein
MIMGKVTAVGDSKITIEASDGTGTKTYAVTSGTTVTQGGNVADTAYVAGIVKVGDSIGVILSSNGQEVTTLMLNLQAQYDGGKH